MACKYGHIQHSFGCGQFDAHEGVFIVPFPASLIEDNSTVGLVRLLIFCGFDPVMSLLAFTRSVRIHSVNYIGNNELPFLDYNFQTERFSGVVATRAQKCLEMGGEIVLEILGREAALLVATSYVSV